MIHNAYLRTPQHHPVEKNPQLLESDSPGTNHPVLLYRRKNFIVPETSLRGMVSGKYKKDERWHTCFIGL